MTNLLLFIFKLYYLFRRSLSLEGEGDALMTVTASCLKQGHITYIMTFLACKSIGLIKRKARKSLQLNLKKPHNSVDK